MRRFITVSDMEIDELYSQETLDAAGWDRTRDLGRPGAFPYTRGVHPTMYRGKLWTMRQFAGFGSADDTNKRFKYLLQAAHGSNANTGLSTANTFTVSLPDTTPPTVTLTQPAGGATVTPTPTFAGIAGNAPGDSATVTVRVYTGSTARPETEVNSTSLRTGCAAAARRQRSTSSRSRTSSRSCAASLAATSAFGSVSQIVICAHPV